MNKNTPEKIFIKENNKYVEITYTQFCDDPAYENRLFLPLYGMLLEVTKADFDEYYKAYNRQIYLDTSSLRRGDISYNSFDSEDFNGEDFLIDESTDVAEQATLNVMLDKLNEILDYLDDCERWLIEQHFFNDIPQTEIAKIHGVNQSSISRQIGKILEKLKILIDN